MTLAKRLWSRRRIANLTMSPRRDVTVPGRRNLRRGETSKAARPMKSTPGRQRTYRDTCRFDIVPIPDRQSPTDAISVAAVGVFHGCAERPFRHAGWRCNRRALALLVVRYAIRSRGNRA